MNLFPFPYIPNPNIPTPPQNNNSNIYQEIEKLKQEINNLKKRISALERTKTTKQLFTKRGWNVYVMNTKSVLFC